MPIRTTAPRAHLVLEELESRRLLSGSPVLPGNRADWSLDLAKAKELQMGIDRLSQDMQVDQQLIQAGKAAHQQIAPLEALLHQVSADLSTASSQGNAWNQDKHEIQELNTQLDKLRAICLAGQQAAQDYQADQLEVAELKAMLDQVHADLRTDEHEGPTA
jgi:hypothetical protein